MSKLYIYLLFIILLTFTGCNDSVNEDSNTTTDTNATSLSNAPTANDFSVSINLNDGITSFNWKTDSNASDIDTGSVLSAVIKTQGTIGTSTIDNENLIYTPTIVGTDTVVLTISDETSKTKDINVNINIILLDGLKILHATYDNKVTNDTSDDELTIYFNKQYAEGSVYYTTSENFVINGNMHIGSTSLDRTKFQSFSFMEINLNNSGTLTIEPDINTTIAIKKDSLTDYAGNFPQEFNAIQIDNINVFASLNTSNNICFNDTNLSVTLSCNDANATKNDGYYNLSKSTRSFTINTETIKDNDTNLIWQKITGNFAGTFAETTQYCDSLNLGNLTSWRLPSVQELLSITNKGRVSLAAYSEFTDTQGFVYITGKTNKENSNSAWAVDFRQGNTLTVSKDTINLLRCVHE